MLGAEGKRFQHSAFNYTEGTSSSPRHAFQKSAAVNPVMVVVMLEEAPGSLVEQVRLRHMPSPHVVNALPRLAAGGARRHFLAWARAASGRATRA
jgi:hypothetical protein